MAQQLIASTTSQALELAQAGAVMIFNHGPSAAHVVSGEDNTVVATAATGSMIARGVAVRFGAAGGFIAAICDAGTATLDISPVAAASDRDLEAIETAHTAQLIDELANGQAGRIEPSPSPLPSMKSRSHNALRTSSPATSPRRKRGCRLPRRGLRRRSARCCSPRPSARLRRS